ncbi:multidrug effflux MFS transporter [Streptomyces alkaliterrae]|uniref:Bcr/CflA family efflux MFS transporter n=1 Tax=Streptomyces alkaliterrae TaxID=2213162 RepID=A0A5P0YVM8_9ACTN|nr:multidrug effflux MFS transporter [Streptomyces alkaliterrae]MBB1257873.1 multidrug effflux MFS transporter [Streptomyces alkaliterrae]MQS02529.1 Bcr/CflA family efflux MFS transporter [Streptomyces alkaliterrae]
MTDSGPGGPAGIPTRSSSRPTSDSEPGAPRPGSSAATTARSVERLTRGRRTGLLLILILGSLTALPALSMDLYLPALPALGGELGGAASQVQLTLTTCLLGLAVGQIVVGPMSDRFGRRRPLLIGMAGYVLASAACALAPTMAALTAFRLVQGLAGAAGIVIARAVVRDLFDGLAMARFFSTLMLVSGAAPVLAPVFGGQLLRVTDWRGIFLTLAVVGTLLALVAARWLPETLPADRRHGGGVREALRTMRTLLRDRVFTGYLLAGSLTFAALFAYVAASPFVVQEIYGASPQTFGLLFMVNSIGLVATGQLNGRVLVGRVRLDTVIGAGLVVTGTAALALLLMTTGVFGDVGLAAVAAGLFVLMSGMALVLPNASSQGLMRAGHAAGTASALIGTSQFLVGAIASPLVGIAGEHTAVPMALTQLSVIVLAAGCFLVMCRPWRQHD